MKSNLKTVETEIAEVHSEENYNIIKENVGHLVDDTDNLNCVKMWQVKKKVCYKKKEHPIAKKNADGLLIQKI